MNGRQPGSPRSRGRRRESFQRQMSELWVEIKARRSGRQGITSSIHRATRDVTGPTGWVWSNAWDELEKHGEAYIDSFDRRLPPSIWVSERDRTRFGQPMPTAERCIEDYRERSAAIDKETRG
jgi:hypothetical protein